MVWHDMEYCTRDGNAGRRSLLRKQCRENASDFMLASVAVELEEPLSQRGQGIFDDLGKGPEHVDNSDMHVPEWQVRFQAKNWKFKPSTL